MEITKLSPRVWRFHDSVATSYLVVGDERAAMIDCGMGKEPVMPLIREITPLPVELFLTHAHGDHYGAAAEFDVVRLDEGERDYIDRFNDLFTYMEVAPLSKDNLVYFRDGDQFDLGGETLTVLGLPGHTPGSVVFRADDSRMLFAGDAVGSGAIVLMAINYAWNLSDYRRSLAAFLPKVDGLDDYTWHAGHYTQAGKPGSERYNPVRRQTVVDMIALCDGILDGSITGKASQESNGEQRRATLTAFLGAAGMVYTEDRIR